MASDQEADDVLDPTAEPKYGTSGAELAERPDSLDGKRITLYSNSKKNADYFLEALGTELQGTYPDAEISDLQYKPAASSPGRRWGLIDELAPESDIALVAYGDCGSCTTYTVFDAIQFEKSGVPTVSFTSDKFIELAQYEVYHQDFPGLPVVTFDHPIGHLSGDEVTEKRVTDDIVRETTTALTTDATEIADHYSDKYSIEDFDGKPEYDACTISLSE